MPSGPARIGAILSILGAVLAIVSDLIMSGIHPATLGAQILLLLIPPALIILGISALAYFRILPRWLLIVNIGLGVLGVLLQLLAYFAHQIFSCFDVCHPATDALIGLLLLIALGGFLLSGIGAFVTLLRS